jgi:hypothetical protein
LRGIRYLLGQQNEDGTWSENEYTGTGFPSVLLTIRPLSDYFLLVLGQYRAFWREMDNSLEQLAQIEPSERILLLPHCLRRSNTCKAGYNGEGLQCVECNPECPVNRLNSAANRNGYKGVCVAPGGRLAIKYVYEKQPRAVIAVACEKELDEGVKGIENTVSEGSKPLIIIVPLVKDGCIDTEVDVDVAIEIISVRCLEMVGKS